MNFRVGSTRYKVQIVAGLSHQGAAAAGLHDWPSRTLSISEAVPQHHRLFVLLHELRHAWTFAYGRPADDEADAQQTATFAIEMFRQLRRQGGLKRLLAMTEPQSVRFSGHQTKN